MGAPAFELKATNNPVENNDDYINDINPEDTFTEERVFALCGPMGSPIHKIGTILKEQLELTYGYECEIIKLSSFIKEHCKGIVEEDPCQGINSLIAAGDRLRRLNGPDILAKLAIKRILKTRKDDEREQQGTSLITSVNRRKCFIIDSIKNQSEFEMFSTVYGKALYFIGVFATEDSRVKALTKKGMEKSEAYLLIEKDSGDNNPEENKKNGQTVRKTFSYADFFVRIDSAQNFSLVDKNIERFLNLIFNTKIVTPSKGEMAMHFAASAAGNSSCLSRQVGACLTDKDGDILSLGWNDVPKYGGGLYPYNDNHGDCVDARCFSNADCSCSNVIKKTELIDDITKQLVSKNIISQADKEDVESIIKKSRVGNLIEFSKAIHAEMLAIISAGKNSGYKVKDGILYCTTYPCHNCARHIVAAGISTVFYIEPYMKSLAIDLHDDSVSDKEEDDQKVRMLAFDGIAPKRYLEFFTYKTNDRKSMFNKDIDHKKSTPKYEVSQESIKALETIVVNKLEENFKDEM